MNRMHISATAPEQTVANIPRRLEKCFHGIHTPPRGGTTAQYVERHLNLAALLISGRWVGVEGLHDPRVSSIVPSKYLSAPVVRREAFSTGPSLIHPGADWLSASRTLNTSRRQPTGWRRGRFFF